MLFNGIGIVHGIRPGTDDNAPPNKVAADVFTRIVAHMSGNLLDGLESVGCACHVANLASRTFLEADGETHSS